MTPEQLDGMLNAIEHNFLGGLDTSNMIHGSQQCDMLAETCGDLSQGMQGRVHERCAEMLGRLHQNDTFCRAALSKVVGTLNY